MFCARPDARVRFVRGARCPMSALILRRSNDDDDDTKPLRRRRLKARSSLSLSIGALDISYDTPLKVTLQGVQSSYTCIDSQMN